MNEHDLNNVVELTDEQLDAISGGYIVDLSEHHGSDYFALVDDDTGKVIGYSNARHFLE